MSIESVIIAFSRIRCNIVVSSWSPTSNLKHVLCTARVSAKEKRRSGDVVLVFPFFFFKLLISRKCHHLWPASNLKDLYRLSYWLRLTFSRLFHLTEAKFFNLSITEFSPSSKYSSIAKQSEVEILTMLLLSVNDFDACRAKLRKEFGTAVRKVHYNFWIFQCHVACALHLKQRDYALTKNDFRTRLSEHKKAFGQSSSWGHEVQNTPAIL